MGKDSKETSKGDISSRSGKSGASSKGSSISRKNKRGGGINYFEAPEDRIGVLEEVRCCFEILYTSSLHLVEYKDDTAM